jgi:hypothetical protein
MDSSSFETVFLYFFSTAAQTLAALVGLSFVALQFRVQFLEQLIERRKRTLIAHIDGGYHSEKIEYYMAAWSVRAAAAEAKKKIEQLGHDNHVSVEIEQRIKSLNKSFDSIRKTRKDAQTLGLYLIISVGVVLCEIPFSHWFASLPSTFASSVFLLNLLGVARLLWFVGRTIHAAFKV